MSISGHRISSSNTHWKLKRLLLRIFFLLLFLFFSFLFFISHCRIMYTKNIIYFQWNNILVNHLLSLICGYKFGLTVSLTCIPQTATKPTLADILRIYYLPNKWHFEDFTFILLPNVACNLKYYRLEFLWVSDWLANCWITTTIS